MGFNRNRDVPVRYFVASASSASLVRTAGEAIKWWRAVPHSTSLQGVLRFSHTLYPSSDHGIIRWELCSQGDHVGLGKWKSAYGKQWDQMKVGVSKDLSLIKAGGARQSCSLASRIKPKHELGTFFKLAIYITTSTIMSNSHLVWICIMAASKGGMRFNLGVILIKGDKILPNLVCTSTASSNHHHHRYLCAAIITSLFPPSVSLTVSNLTS